MLVNKIISKISDPLKLTKATAFCIYAILDIVDSIESLMDTTDWYYEEFQSPSHKARLSTKRSHYEKRKSPTWGFFLVSCSNETFHLQQPTL